MKRKEIAACPEFDFLIPCSCPSRATRPPLPVQPLDHPREREPVPFLKGPFSDAVVCARRLPVAVRTERHARVVGRLLAHTAVRPGMSGFAPPFDPQAIEGISRIHPKYALLRGGPLRVGDVARRCGLRPWIAQARYERSWFWVNMICQWEWAAGRNPLPGGES